jgi:hypothetical protein
MKSLFQFFEIFFSSSNEYFKRFSKILIKKSDSILIIIPGNNLLLKNKKFEIHNYSDLKDLK